MDLFLPVKHLPLQTNCTDPLSDQLPEITKKKHHGNTFFGIHFYLSIMPLLPLQ